MSFLPSLLGKEPLPPSVGELLSDPRAVRARYLGAHATWRRSRAKSLVSRRSLDTALACLYRIYELIVIGRVPAYRMEVQYFCHMHQWAVADIPDPADPDPVRGAVLAMITHLLCDAFNERIKLGLHRDIPAIVGDFEALKARPKVLEYPPAWATRIERLSETVVISRPRDVPCPRDREWRLELSLLELNVHMRVPECVHFI
ncbi:hypothetical protein PENSPDRAFT_758614 [Peniophora sp. CONT]|nr:hypothetical protein PENSPDRAFT_758614 [Peniophora sp. CONT]